MGFGVRRRSAGGGWPDLRRRGSLLGSGCARGCPVRPGRGRRVSTVAPQLAEERRLFYVAVTQGASPPVGDGRVGEEEQPSRFLDELDPLDGPRPLATCGSGNASARPRR